MPRPKAWGAVGPSPFVPRRRSGTLNEVPQDRDAFAPTLVNDRPAAPESVPSSLTGGKPSAAESAGAAVAEPEERTPEASDSLVGSELDHFVVERRIGRGGMGTVYVARDRSLDRRVAIKVLGREVAGSPHREERFIREARAQAQLAHPNVVAIYYIGHRPAHRGAAQDPVTASRGVGGSPRPPASPASGGALYLVMELVEGEPLDALLERGQRLEPEQARIAMIEVARGLRAARRAGIVHRDIKPSNLLRTREGTVKIADFGLAKPLEPGADVSLTQEGAIVGSPAYMAPEQARGESIDHRADMYAMGATFYHLLTGRPPFPGSTPLAVIAKHLSQPLPPVRSVAPEVPEALARIVERLLAKDPAARYADYDALLADLEAAAPRQVAYAGFWVRGAAVAIDLAVAAVLVALLDWPGMVLHLLHVTVGHAYFGRTLAKHFLKLRVTRTDGTRLGLLRSVARTFLSMWLFFLIAVSITLASGYGGLTEAVEQVRPDQLDALRNLLVASAVSNGALTILFAAGLVVAGFHAKKRALHDLLVGSVVRYALPAGQAVPNGDTPSAAAATTSDVRASPRRRASDDAAG
jgi:uncharacterized RDD family membrane protein YckC